MSQLSPATRYFLEYWADIWSGMSSSRELLKLFNPRVVIQELLDEITLNKQRNVSNENFFKRILGGYYKNDPGAKGSLSIHLQMLLKELDVAKQRPRYLPLLCGSALAVFSELKYFEDSTQALVALMGTPTLDHQQKQDIKAITKHLIVELRCLGYDDDEIRDIPRKMFSNIQTSNDSFFWEFPHFHKFNEWKDAKKVKEFRGILEAHQEALSESDRLLSLLTFAKKRSEPFTYLFKVNGMVGKRPLTVANVSFYSPATKKMIADDSDDHYKEDEWFGSVPGSPVINAAVIVDSVNAKSGELIARSKVERALDLCRRVLPGESAMWLSKSCLVLDDSGRVAFASRHTFERAQDDFTKNIQLKDGRESGLERRLAAVEKVSTVSKSNGWGRRFEEACHWLRKAEESISHVEQLLSYWICIETLCAKSDDETANWFETKNSEPETDIFLIKEVLGKMVALGSCYGYGWRLRGQFEVQRPYHNHEKISRELVRRAQLDAAEGETIFLVNFLNCAEEIKNELPDSLLREQMSEVIDFYSDKETALRTLKMYLQTAQDELAFIYRMRNKIAHDGSSNHFLLPSTCKLAAHYAETFVGRVSFFVDKRSDTSLSSILIKAVQEYDRVVLRLQTEEPRSVFFEAPLGNS